MVEIQKPCTCPLCDASTSTHSPIEHVLADHHSDHDCLKVKPVLPPLDPV